MECKDKQIQKADEKVELSKDQIIELMGIYLNEWMHRDSLLWKQTFQYFYANLIVIVLPYIAEFLHIKLPVINKDVFPVIGILMSLVFLYIGIGYSIRLRASSLTYERMMKKLGNKEYERISIKDEDWKNDESLKELRWGKPFSFQLSLILVIAMFISLMLISLMLIYIVE